MSRVKASLDHKRIRRLIWLVLTVFVLLGYSLQSVAGSVGYSILMQVYGTISSPPVILEESNVTGASTIYTNKTSAKVSVEAPLFDYVDSNDPDVDSSADRGMHSNFPAQQADSDSMYDTLTEENTEAIEDYVDNISDVDNSSDVGTHSNFENQKYYDSIYDTLTEQNTGVGEITKVGTDTSGTGTSLTLSFSHTLVSGTARIVIISIGVENGDTIDVSTVTYGGVTMTLAVEGITGTSGFRYLCEIWYILEDDLPSDGSKTVAITCTGSAYELEINAFCSEYTGVSQGAPEATAEHHQTTGTTITNDIGPSDNAWVISAVGSGNTGSWTHGEGQVEVLDFTDTSSAFAVAELRGASGETSLDSTYSGTVNRLERVAASWTEAIENNYQLDLEIQFTAVIDFLPTEALCINTGTFSGTEDINVDFWNGTGWENLATDLTAYSCNYYTVSLTSTTFTIRFRDGTTDGDTTQDQWQIDASLLRIEGAGSKEDAVDQQSDVDSSTDVGTHSDFNAMKTKDGYNNLTEAMGEQQYTFFEDWESGSISGANWSTYSSHVDGRIVVDTDSPYGGSTYALWMDQQTNNNNLNELITAYDFSGATEVILSFYHNEQGDENTAGSDHTDHLNSDAVYFTNNGNYWYHLVDLVDPSDWTYVEINITADPDFVSPANSSFAIKFAQFDNFYRPNDGRGFENINITYTTAGSSDYTMDLEVQWTDLPYSLPNEELCIYGGTMGTEDIKVDVWNGSSWENIVSDLNASAWNNITVTSYITSSNFTIRFKGGNETGDTSEDTWQIDVALIHIWYGGGESYKLNLEVQWTGADYTRTNEELCIKTGTFSGSENIQVKIWNNTGSSWHWVMNLTASQWNNVSITSYLTSSTFTVQFLGGTETGDTNEDSWNIDATVLHVWTSEGTYDYVLRVVNQVADNWTVNLRVYDSSNISRLSSLNTSLHDGTSSNQIAVSGGSMVKSEGEPYDLPGGVNSTVYISVSNLQATTTGTSYLYVHLKVRVPNSSTYILYVITFEVT